MSSTNLSNCGDDRSHNRSAQGVSHHSDDVSERPGTSDGMGISSSLAFSWLVRKPLLLLGSYGI